MRFLLPGRLLAPAALVAAVLVAGLAAADDKPATPLGTWMQQHFSHPILDGNVDFAKMQQDFQLLASKAPSADYANWQGLAGAGATAAGNKDLAGVKKSCKPCHDAYKKKYIAEFPTKPFP